MTLRNSSGPLGSLGSCLQSKYGRSRIYDMIANHKLIQPDYKPLFRADVYLV